MSVDDDAITNLRKALKKLQGAHRNLAFAARDPAVTAPILHVVHLKDAVVAEIERLGGPDALASTRDRA